MIVYKRKQKKIELVTRPEIQSWDLPPVEFQRGGRRFFPMVDCHRQHLPVSAIWGMKSMQNDHISHFEINKTWRSAWGSSIQFSSPADSNTLPVDCWNFLKLTAAMLCCVMAQKHCEQILATIRRDMYRFFKERNTYAAHIKQKFLRNANHDGWQMISTLVHELWQHGCICETKISQCETRISQSRRLDSRIPKFTKTIYNKGYAYRWFIFTKLHFLYTPI